jgi:hypothetical protein
MKQTEIIKELDETAEGIIEGGNLSYLNNVNILVDMLYKFKTFANNHSVKDSSIPAGGFSGANSMTMRSSQSGTAVSYIFNNVHREGYYGFDRCFILQIQVGGALDYESKKILLDIAKTIIERFNYESDLGESYICDSSGTNWSSMMLVAPTRGNSYTPHRELRKRYEELEQVDYYRKMEDNINKGL